MIHVDESDPVGEVLLSFPYKDVKIQKGVDPKDLYDLETEVGRGKFGTVYKCKEKSTGLCLAAKYVSVPKKEDRRNVEREVEIMRELQHPRLIQLYDAFENGKMMVVILELIEGGELFERVIDDDFVLTEKSCTVFMRQICEGIGFIHKQKILHLDMKPENILCLTKTGNRIKIIDFGLARRFDKEKKLQVLFGTPEFVAPEVVNFDEIGYGTDMWSVGVICYVLLSGLSPFMGHTDVETMANVTIAKYDFEDDAFDDITDGAKDFIKKLLNKDINNRLTADECVNHPWLKRKLATPPPPKKSPSISSMDVAKDNLKQFVERWNEHPNSPYVFETHSHLISSSFGSLRRMSSLQSLSGLSPSPCGSLASSEGSDVAFLDTFNGHLSPAHFDFRRASDSSYVVKATDITERVNLAEEIRKLSDKLFQLSTMPTIISKEPIKRDTYIDKPLAMREISHSISKPININNPIYTNANNLDKTSPININNDPSSSDCKVPWRRTKFRITGMNRDVPLSPKLTTSISYREQFNSKLSTFNKSHSFETSSKQIRRENSPNGTKNLLLKLLEHWDGPQGPQGPKSRQNSMSSDYDSDSLGQRTISSLNTFFQSRSTNKKITPFHKSDTIQHTP